MKNIDAPRGFDKNGITICDEREYSDSKNPCAAKSVALLENPALLDDDRQALETIISLWPELSPETKIGIMQTIESARRARSANRQAGRGRSVHADAMSR